MRVLVYSTHSYDRAELRARAEQADQALDFTEASLTAMTASLARGYPCVCCFVNDRLDGPVLERLAAGGTRLVALRCAGFNNVDLEAAQRLGMTIVRVPAYSPDAVAEFAVGLMLTLMRKIHRAYIRVREGNFELDGLVGAELGTRTVGIIGCGAIGSVVCRILAAGFGCRVLVVDPGLDAGSAPAGTRLVTLDQLLGEADVVSLHCPLTPDTHHLIDASAIAGLRPGAVLINTSRGGIVDASAVIDGLKRGHIGALGMDVYEEEGDMFFHDLSEQIIQDDVLARLMTFPNVLITGHQAFLTRRALEAIARTTIQNIVDFEHGTACENLVTLALASGGPPAHGKAPEPGAGR